MIAGGTGIAPMIQVIRACLRNPADRSKITLLYANVNADDILLKADLETLQEAHGLHRFKIYYVLNNPPPAWKGGVGFITKEHIEEHIPNPATTDSKLLLCGKPGNLSSPSSALICFLGPPPMISAMRSVVCFSNSTSSF
jgi:cytochrome-b5 reductase